GQRAARLSDLRCAQHRAAHAEPRRVAVPALRHRRHAAQGQRARSGAGMSRARAGALAAALLAGARAAGAVTTARAAAGPTRVGGQFRYWSNTDHNDNRDWIGYWVPGPFHVLLEVWDFQRGKDQFRPEVGVHLRDFRRSSYSVEWRHENEAERLTFSSEQVLSHHLVGRLSVAPIISAESTAVVWSA